MSQTIDIQALSRPAVGNAAAGAPAAGAAVRRKDGGKASPASPAEAGSASAALEQSLRQVNHYLQAENRGLEFSVDKSTGRTVIKVVDRSSGEVLRQIPPEYVIKLAQTLLESSGAPSTGVKLEI